MSSAFETLRLTELAQSESTLRALAGDGARILEIGSGTGWQARALAERGFDVTGVDLPVTSEISNHARARVWPIVDYDGVNLPFPDGHFDAVYSSNVLEHVTELEALNAEILRVLKPGGSALHLLPNPQWRLASLLTYYPGQVVDALRVLRRKLGASKPASPAAIDAGAPASGAKKSSVAARIAQRLLPPTHGSTGSAFTEIARYRKAQWDTFFTSHGWRIMRYGNNGLFASGDYLLGRILPISARAAVGRAMGGIAHVYVLKRAQDDE